MFQLNFRTVQSRLWLLCGCAVSFCASLPPAANAAVSPAEKQVAELLAQMTQDERIGQMGIGTRQRVARLPMATGMISRPRTRSSRKARRCLKACQARARLNTMPKDTST